jgi:hypothetical protein
VNSNVKRRSPEEEAPRGRKETKVEIVKLGFMKTGTYNIGLGFDQILDLVRQLPKKEKIRLSKELEREIIGTKLTILLKAFKTDDLDQETINKEVEIVRTELYAKSKAK